MPKQNDIEKILTRGVESVIVAENLAKRLSSGKKLRVKLGIDPTAPDIHLGHSVVLRKLRQFQNAGHTAVLIIGDFTAQVGDPSGRDSTRPVLSEKDIKKNLAGYLKQAGKIIALEKTEIHPTPNIHLPRHH
jgi:tyrosyl-tRNA synthetase